MATHYISDMSSSVSSGAKIVVMTWLLIIKEKPNVRAVHLCSFMQIKHQNEGNIWGQKTSRSITYLESNQDVEVYDVSDT